MFDEEKFGGLHRWGICLFRSKTDSTLALGLPYELNEALNLVTFNDLPTEPVFESINKWAIDEFPSWEVVGLASQYEGA